MTIDYIMSKQADRKDKPEIIYISWRLWDSSNNAFECMIQIKSI